MRRVSIVTATNKLIESQSGGTDLQALMSNAVAAGYDPADITVKIVSDEEFATLLAAASVNVVPASISDRQFFQQLAIRGTITQEEALASNAAVIPEAILTMIEALPEDQRFSAKMLVSGATVFERNHPLMLVLTQTLDITSEELDEFFIAAAQL